MLVLTHDTFFGRLQATRSLEGITLSHRIADRPAADVEVHAHVEAHFVLVTSGHYVSSARATLSPRLVCIYNPPGTTHRDHFMEGRGSFFTISLSADRFAEVDDLKLHSMAVYLGSRASGVATALLMECARWDSSSSLVAESLCFELAQGAAATSQSSGQRPKWLAVARELLLDGYKESLGVGEIARIAGVHPTHLAREFRTWFGCTPGDLLRARRLERGANLLQSANGTIAEVALASGFADQAQFTKAFKRTYGVTPGSYRRLMRSRNVAF